MKKNYLLNYENKFKPTKSKNLVRYMCKKKLSSQMAPMTRCVSLTLAMQWSASGSGILGPSQKESELTSYTSVVAESILLRPTPPVTHLHGAISH